MSTSENNKQVLDVAAENARHSAQEQSASLQRTQTTIDLQNLALVFLAAAWGAAFERLLPFGGNDIKENIVIFSFWLVLSCILAVLAWRLISNTKKIRYELALSSPEVHQQLLDLTAENAELERSGTKLEAWLRFQHGFEGEVYRFERGVNEKLRAMRHQKLDPSETEREIQQSFQAVLDALVMHLRNARRDLLNYDPGETYFFDIFELDESDNRLHRIARECTPGVDQHGRTWAISEGDVGDCVFKQRTVHVDYRLNERNPNDPTFRASDEKNFGCRLSTPIFAADNRPHSAYGAICVTSSEPARLTKEDVIFFENLSQPCASLFQRRRLSSQAIQRYRTSLRRNEAKRVNSGEYPAPTSARAKASSMSSAPESAPSE